MTLGVYTVGSWLPSETELAGEYGVSVSTIRQALRLLSLLGFIQTLHGKGSRVLSLDHQHVPQLIHHEEYRQDFLLYLSGLQLWRLPFAPRRRLPFPASMRISGRNCGKALGRKALYR